MKGFFFYVNLSSDQIEREQSMAEIIYLDIDGTLRDEREGIPESVVWALNECRKNKIQIVICTGRNQTSIQDDVMKLPWDGMICGGGCYIQYYGNTLWEKCFPVGVIKAIKQYIAKSNLLVSFETKEKIFMNYSAARFYREDIERKTREFNLARKECFLRQNKIQYQENMKAFDCEKSKVHKVCIIGTKNQIEKIKASWKSEIEIVQEKQWNGKWYLELLPRGCDKGYAVRRLNQYLGISRNETMCFGDSENDIAMMEESGTAVVVESNNRVMRQYASSVCESVTEDGIYKELVRRNIIQPKIREVQCV